MRSNVPLTLLFVSVSLGAVRAQTAGGGTLPDPLTWPVTAQDWQTTTREFSEPVTNALTGEVTVKPHTVVEICTGLNYLDASGNWQPSQDLIELTPGGGATAPYGAYKVTWSAAGLNDDAALTIVTHSNRVFQARVLGIYYFNPANGASKLLALPSSEAVAELVPPNQIVYRSAFNSDLLKADLLYTYTKGGFESDVILTAQPKLSPADVGFDPGSALLQVRHQWIAPAPQIRTITVQTASGAEVTDQLLDFGDAWFPHGRAFLTSAGARDTNVAAVVTLAGSGPGGTNVPVAKEWQQGSASSTLIESVAWSSIAPELAALPLMAMGNGAASSNLMATAAGQGPSRNLGMRSAEPIRLAGRPSRFPGLVLDYTYVPATGTNYEFFPWSSTGGAGGTNGNGGDLAYEIRGNTYYSGTLTLHENCVIKLESNYYLATTGGVKCYADCYGPSILTSAGYPMYGSGNGGHDCTAYEPYAALWLYDIPTNVTLSGLNIRHAQIGVRVDGGCNWGVTHTLSNCRMYMCENGVYMAGENVSVNNSYKCQVTVDYDNTQPQCTSFTGSFQNDCPLAATSYLQGSVEAGILALESGHNPPADGYIFNNPQGPPQSYNKSCWIYGLPGFTAMSVTNDVQYGLNPLQYTCTLITPHHALTVAPSHEGSFTGHWFGFLDSNNNWQVVQCAGHIAVPGPGGQAHLGLVAFSNRVSGTIQPVPLLPDDVSLKVPFFNWPNANYDEGVPPCPSTCLPCVGTQQNQFSFPTDWEMYGPKFGSDQGGFGTPSVWTGGNTNWDYPEGYGDSAHPIYVWLPNQNQLALAAVWETGRTGDLCLPEYVNPAIDALDTMVFGAPLDEYPSVVNLSSYPDCTLPSSVDLVNCNGGY